MPIKNLKQGQLKIGDKTYFFVNVDHTAEYFELDLHKKMLKFVTVDGHAIVEDVEIVVPALYQNKTYHILGTYKKLKDRQKFRDPMVEAGMNLDQNWVILEQL